ncbi:MAG TPA: 3-hydroxyacyl-CoA dehydrogenase NAD-binding domain-containing protein [Gemmatimonadales bacterium]|nr:3-hydroxyacyl-CoA dehydrogenase NAD-binding domain-containing protein [Gemmatimonadales bacterium]
MSRFEQPKVAVVGAGPVGAGWTTMIVAAGWGVTLYDPDSSHLQQAIEAIPGRVEQLLDLDWAHPKLAERGLSSLRQGRSLLEAIGEADWIIEAGPADLHTKQRLLEQIEQVCRMAAVITSCSPRDPTSQLAGRMRRPERLLALHSHMPVEFIPVVEVVPGPATDGACVEDVRFWLSLLGRTPIVLKKEVIGDATRRIRAAVFRETVQLVLEGVLDADDVDRLLADGLALRYASAGMFGSLILAGKKASIDVVISEALAEFENIWHEMATWQKLPIEDQKRLIRLVEKAYPEATPIAREERDRRLQHLLVARKIELGGPTEI